MAQGEYQVDPTVLAAAGEAIGRAGDVQSLADLRRVSNNSRAYGHPNDASRALAAFCEQWTNGLNILANDARTISKSLIQVASAYRVAEERSGHRFTVDARAGEPQ